MKINTILFNEFSADQIEVVWDKRRCIHAGKCAAEMSKVFQQHKQGQIFLNEAPPEEIKEIIDGCPSGALRYRTLYQ